MKYSESWLGEDVPDYGFIDGHYVHRRLLEKYDITEDCKVIAEIVLGGDNKWRVYDLKVLY